MPSRDGREYRAFGAPEIPEGQEYRVRGHACTWDRYLLYRDGETEFYEQVDPGAFNGADLSDVVYRVDHQGQVYARSSAGSLTLTVDGRGLGIEADLSRTAAARAHYEDIVAGNYPKMSFAFTVAEDAWDPETRTRTIRRIDKVYDVSPVSFPANPGTDISARAAWIDGVIERETAERLEAARKEETRKRLELRLRTMPKGATK
jgi:hypothetical protein